MATQQPFTAQQLVRDSGYRSYSTFSLAFKQRIGQTVTACMRETDNGGLKLHSDLQNLQKLFQNLQTLTDNEDFARLF